MLNYFFINLLRKYQRVLSPKLRQRGIKCLFEPSCSQYAIDCLQKFDIIKAGSLIVYRLLSCNPINARRINKHKIIHG